MDTSARSIPRTKETWFKEEDDSDKEFSVEGERNIEQALPFLDLPGEMQHDVRHEYGRRREDTEDSIRFCQSKEKTCPSWLYG